MVLGGPAWFEDLLDNPGLVLQGPGPSGASSWALCHLGLCPETGWGGRVELSLRRRGPVSQAWPLPRAWKTVSWAWLLLPSRLGQSGNNDCSQKLLLTGFWKTAAGHRQAALAQAWGSGEELLPRWEGAEEVADTMDSIVNSPRKLSSAWLSGKLTRGQLGLFQSNSFL